MVIPWYSPAVAASKVAISLPPELLRLIDLECRARGMSRSEYIRSAVTDLLKRRAERAADADYDEAYRKMPEDPADAAAYLAMTASAVTSLPWDA